MPAKTPSDSTIAHPAKVMGSLPASTTPAYRKLACILLLIMDQHFTDSQFELVQIFRGDRQMCRTGWHLLHNNCYRNDCGLLFPALWKAGNG
jgi:hypothetical protein